MHAETEQEVLSLLTDAGYWEDSDSWRALGNRENNYGQAGNQQEDAVGALTEKVVNSIDARLLGECLSREIEPEGSVAPKTTREAVARFFDNVEDEDFGRYGLISQWIGTEKITREAREITVTATGSKSKPNSLLSFTISDSGEGQTPGDFPRTLMSLGESNKLRVPFVQGKFNMGGTGALPFCSPEHNFQLVVSRRRSDLLPALHSPRDAEWGFTIVRRARPDGVRRLSSYQYLAPLRQEGVLREPGQVLSFNADSLEIFPDENPADSEYAVPYGRAAKHGTLVKLYDFQLRGDRAAITGSPGILRRLEVALPRAILPMLLVDTRYKRNSGAVAYGVQNRLENVSEARANLEPGFPIHSFIPVKDREVRVDVYAFKRQKNTSGRTQRNTYRPGAKRSVAYLVNGQSHAFEGDMFFSRLNMPWLAKQRALFVAVDCSELDELYGEDLFLPSRDRKRDNDVNGELQEGLEGFLKNSPELRTLEQERRSSVVREKLDRNSSVVSVVSDVLKRFPRILDFLARGRRIGPVVIPVTEESSTFHGRFFPTRFDLVRPKPKDQGVSRHEVTESGVVRLEFSTDAVADYFTRDDLPGRVKVRDVVTDEDVTSKFGREGPIEGQYRMWSSKVQNARPVGEEISLEVTIDDENDFARDPFVFRVLVSVKRDPSPPGTKSKSKKTPKPSLDVPQPVRVWREDSPRHREGDQTWEDLSESGLKFDDTIAVKVVGGGDSAYDYFINMDNRHAAHARVGAADADISDARWESIMHVLAMSMVASSSGKGKAEDEFTAEQLVSAATSGMAPVAMLLGAFFEESPPVFEE